MTSDTDTDSDTDTGAAAEAPTEPATEAAESDAISRLADRGEETLRRLADLPGGQRAVRAFNDLRERVDDLSRKVRGIDALQARVEALEKRVDALDGGAPPESD